MTRVLWADATAGVAGDMLAGALVDAGVPLAVMRDAVDAVLPGIATLSSEPVLRAGMQAVKFDVAAPPEDEHRHLADIHRLLDAASIESDLHESIKTVFGRLAEAEAAAHGVGIDEVHFHEVGAVDSIADIVSVCAGLHWLQIDELCFGELELGSGTVRAAHGVLPVPTPAAIRLTTGLRVRSTHAGECATPTGLAILAALGRQEELPPMAITGHGVGAGTRDTTDRANVVRIVLGERVASHMLIETNVDDMDPRLWPRVLELLMAGGAQDAWLTPIVMKKGRPAHTLSVLCDASHTAALQDIVFEHTSAIGVRCFEVEKVALERVMRAVELDGIQVRVKIAGRGMRIVNVSIEFDDVAVAAKQLLIPEREVLERATTAAAASGFVVGGAFERD